MKQQINLAHNILDNSDIGIVVIKHGLIINTWNHWLENSSGIKANEALGKTILNVFSELNTHPIVSSIQACLENATASMLMSTSSPHPLPLYKKESGNARTQLMMQQIDIKPIISESGETMAMVQIRDITDAVLKERALQHHVDEITERELQVRTVLENTLDGIISINENGLILEFNAAAENIFGYHRNEILGQSINQLIFTESSKEQSEHDSNRITNCLALAQNATQEILAMRKNGSKFMLEISLNKMILNDEILYVGSMRDITERTQAEQLIRHMAQHDALTDLPNRSLFRERLEQSMATTQRHPGEMLAIMFLDLDRFKTINDTLGHHTGDALLIAVTERLKNVTRNVDTVARLGGDEFAIIQTGVHDTDGVVKLAQKIIDKVAEVYEFDGNEVNTSTSIGITLYPEDEKDADQLLQNADMAMYKAKRAGRNNFQFYCSEMHDEIQHSVNMEKDIRRALIADEFVMYFQPQINLANGTIVSVEALVRWQHPENGLVPPNEFIPIAEDSGLILPLGKLVLEKSCQWAKQWQDAGNAPLRVAVNLSAVQFNDPELVESITSILEKVGLAAEYLELEITESFLMENASKTIRTLNQLHDLGLMLAIDDFGTGYSSLSYLKRFPVNKIKIDQSFVNDITTDKDDAIIVRSVIGLGHNLGLNVIAEGVETEEQLRFLQINGCDEIQGYFIGKPMPADAFVEFMKKPIVLPCEDLDLAIESLQIQQIAS
ncbi:MAG: EAL domain-containing protein [Gammaproteobacteria bacterium]|nr:EAL domain-containing protein [Gammaproteobacteria bacterium]